MKYSEILSFDPITDVIQFDNLKEKNYQIDLVKTFVYPDYFVDTVIPVIVDQLKNNGTNQHGIQVVGNYGSGKSHLMSLIMLIAQHEEYLQYVSNDKAKEILAPIAGKFKVHYFELGTDMKLWDVVTYQLQNFLDANGVDFQFDPHSLKMYREQLEDMLAAFEDKFPDKQFLLVIDEMLSYLRTRSASGQLDHDLQVLQALGQLCSNNNFGFMFGVQELIYQAKEFQFVASMLLKVKDRYVDLTIRKEDVAFVAQNRLLRKSADQKATIRHKLEKFISLFGHMHDNLQEYIDLYPVHPLYFDNFQKIKIGRSQREVLKTLSAEFERIKDQEIPEDNPGLITHDQYWEHMMKSSAIRAIPEFNKVAETVEIIHSKIDSNFDGPREKKKPLAKRIVNATAIKILQGELSKRNGARAETLADELCYIDPMADDHDMLVDIIDTCAKNVVKATSGQYFEQDEESSEYRLRTEGGVNFEQQITDFAESMAPAQKDSSFFRFLTEALGLADSNPYRTGFLIYKHEIEWRSHRITRDGYIFMGHPNEKSTTHPKQSFYMVFMPIFQEDKKKRNLEDDEVYFVFDGLSEAFKETVTKYGAAYMLWNSAESTQKIHYRTAYEALLKKARKEFDSCYLDSTKIYYTNNEPRILKSYQLPGGGAPLVEYFNRVASDTFESQFLAETPEYPIFAQASQVITNDNRDRFIQAAKAKVIRPHESIKDGEAVLAALECFNMGELSVQDSKYAQTVLDRLEEKGTGKVLNRDEIISVLPNSDGQIWHSLDFHIESDLEFIVLTVLVVCGEIEITLNNGVVINASNIESIRSLGKDDYFSFASIKRPKGINLPLIKAITTALCGKDLSNRLDKEDTYSIIVNTGRKLAAETATFVARTLSNGAIICSGTEVVSAGQVLHLKNQLDAFKGFCDKLATYTSQAKLKNIPWDIETVNKLIGSYKESEQIKLLIKIANDLQSKVDYLRQATQYVPANMPLQEAMQSAIDRFKEILDECKASNGENANVQNYIAELDDIKAKYIEWYLKVYRNYCLSDIDNATKTQVLNSEEFIASRVLSELVILNKAVFENLRGDIIKLKTADPNVEHILQSSPYANFDPRTQRTESMKSIHDLRQEVYDLFNTWVEQIKTFLQEDEQQESLRLMDSSSQDYANRIINGMEDLRGEFTARAVVEFIQSLCQGLVRVDVDYDMLCSHFNRPMTIDEAKATFDRLMYRISNGKDLRKVRIVFNNNNN